MLNKIVVLRYPSFKTYVSKPWSKGFHPFNVRQIDDIVAAESLTRACSRLLKS